MNTHIFHRRIARFGLVGAISTILDLLVLNSLGLILNVYVATAIAFLVGSTNGYILNSRYVFKKARTVESYVKYFFITSIGLILTEAIIYMVHDLLNYRLNIGKLVAVFVVLFWNYTGSKLWAFK